MSEADRRAMEKRIASMETNIAFLVDYHEAHTKELKHLRAHKNVVETWLNTKEPKFERFDILCDSIEEGYSLKEVREDGEYMTYDDHVKLIQNLAKALGALKS